MRIKEEKTFKSLFFSSIPYLILRGIGFCFALNLRVFAKKQQQPSICFLVKYVRQKPRVEKFIWHLLKQEKHPLL